MLKPPVLTGGVVRPIAGNPRLRCPVRGIGRLSAGFADALLARYGLLSGGDLYPDALLVFREAEEREAVQTAGDVQLTQLTLRLALQLSEYVSVTGGQSPSPMELHSLSRSLTTCLTSLERRDTATCREIRLLLKSLPLKNDTAPAEGLAAIQLARQTVERRLERLEIRERLSPSAPTAQTERRPFFPRTAGSVPGQTDPPADRQRERPAERQARLIRQTDTQVQIHRETRHHSETHSIDPVQFSLPQEPGRQPETAPSRQPDGQWESDSPRQETRQPEKGQSRRELSTDRAADTDRLLPQETPHDTRLSLDIPRLVGAVQAEQAAAHRVASPGTDGTAVRSVPQSPVSPMTRRPAPAAQLREQALTVQKERLLRLLSVTDESERETIWQLVEHRLINRHSIETNTQADTMESLTRTIRQSTYEEYTRLLQLLEQRFQAAESAATPQAPVASPSGTEAAPHPVTTRPSERQMDSPSGGATQSAPPAPPTKQVLLQQAAPILTWLEQTLAAGNVPRSKLLTLLKDSPAPVQTAFLTLAKQSGVFEKTWSTAKSGEHLTLLAKRSQRRELETLLRWTYVREAPAAPATPAPPSVQETAAPEEPSHSEAGEKTSPAAAELAAESAAMADLRHFLSETRLTRRQELTALIAAAPAEERRALLQELETENGDRELPTYAALGETERLVYLMEHSRDLPALHRRLEASAPLRQLEQSRSLERELLRRLTVYTQERGGDRTEAAAHLLDGLSETGQQALLVQLRRVPGQTADKMSPAEKLSPTTSTASMTSTPSADAPAQQVRELLAFRTQKEYKSFRYQLTQFLRERESPPSALAPTLTRWLTEQRQSEARELAQAAAPLIARRPAAWYQALLGSPVAGTDGSPVHPPVVSDDPAPWAMPSQPQTLRLSRTAQRQDPPSSPTETPVSPDALQAGLLRSLAAGEGSAVRLLRLLQPPPGVVEAALADLKAALPPPPPPPQRQARPPIARQSPLSLRRRPPQPQTQMQSQSQSQTQAQSQLQSQIQMQAQVQRQIQRSPETLSPLLSQRRELRLLETILQERATRIGKRLAPPLPRRMAAEQVPHLPLSPLTQRIGTPMAALGHRTADLRPTLSTAPLLGQWTEPATARQLAHHRPPTAEGPSPTGQTMPPPPSPAGTELVYPPVETELELRRRQSVQEVRETVTQTAAQTAARTVEQQLPALQLLRRQTLEQEQTLGKQQKSLGALQTQLERQEILIQQVLERASVPAGSTPAEVRKMTKAVLQEMESQLRVERQRRGLV